MNAPAASSSQDCPRLPARSATPAVIGAISGCGAKVSATSRSFQTHRNWKIAERGDRRHDQRQQDPEEDLHVAGAVDPGRLDDRRRDLLHEVVQQEDRQRQAEDRVARSTTGQNEVPAGAEVDVERAAAGSARPGSARSAARTPRRTAVAARKSIQANAYAASSASAIGMMHRRDRDDERVDQEDGERAVAVDTGVRGSSRSVTPGWRRTSTSRVVGISVGGPERGDEQPERRNRPQDRQAGSRARTPTGVRASSWRPGPAWRLIGVARFSGVASW